MDISLEYQKMCEKAEEIQSQWKPKDFDLIEYRGEILYLLEDSDGNCYGPDVDWVNKREKRGVIWLPRQDELQEMVWIRDGYDFLHSFVDKVFIDEDYAYYRFMTPCQIWLAFVMKRKYGKIWDGTNWVK